MRSTSLFFLILLISGYTALGQETNVSPFSRISVGDFQAPSFSQNFAMGGLSYGIQSSNNINPYNPASYSRLVWTSFEAAVVSRNYWLQTQNQQEQANFTSFNHLALCFPLAPWWGMTLAIMPVSTVGYNYKTNHEYESIDSLNVTYSNAFFGTGGLNKVMLGHGFSINRRLFLGFNFSYIFGKMEYQETINFTLSGDYHNTANLERVESGGIYLDFGAQYRVNLGSKWRLDMGAVFTPIQGLDSKRSAFSSTYSNISGVNRIIDSVSYSENKAFSIVLPPKYGIGFILSRNERIKVGLDLDYTMWSLSNYNTFNGLEDVYGIKAGAEYKDSKNRYTFRLGARYTKMPIVLNNSTSNEMALTAGFAWPFRSKDKLSFTYLNIGVEVGKRGKIADQWLEEKFINVNVGLTLNNKWFIKRVYD